MRKAPVCARFFTDRQIYDSHKEIDGDYEPRSAEVMIDYRAACREEDVSTSLQLQLDRNLAAAAEQRIDPNTCRNIPLSGRRNPRNAHRGDKTRR
jgi:hypothetical protein